MLVQKRSGTVEDFSKDKVFTAIKKAAKSSMSNLDLTETFELGLERSVVDPIVQLIKQRDETKIVTIQHVDDIHYMVEDRLMGAGYFNVAREYISYRERNKQSIFNPRAVYKPFEYPELNRYVDAIQQSYWLFSEFDYTSDIQDFKVKLEDHQREAIRRSMLAISQVEVKVKDFWAKVGDVLPKPEIQEVGAVFAESECFDDKTEVLTDNGWVLFKDLSKSAKVAQYCLDTGEVTFDKPLTYVEKEFNGNMHNYSGKSSDICVTPKHEILVKHPAKSTYKKARSESGVWSRNYRFPTSGYGTGNTKLTSLERLLIAIQADGSLYGMCPTGEGRKDFTINLGKERKIERLKGIFKDLDLSYNESKRDNGQTVFNAKLPEEVDVTLVKTFGWVDLESIGKDWVDSFVEELGQWDSHVRNNNTLFYSTNEEAIDKVQAILTLGGYTGFKGVNRTAGKSLQNLNPNGVERKTSKTCWVLSITPIEHKVYPKREEVSYNGLVYCVEMPKGTVVTRRNGSVSIQGNCRHSRAYSFLLELLNLNKDFSEIMEVPVFRKRFEYLSRSVKGTKTGELKDYIEALLLFTLFIENVSLFSQFLVISTYNKELNVLSGMSNAIAATSLEENLHAMFGADLIKEIRKERPDIFTEEFSAMVSKLAQEAYEAEEELIDWIFEEGEDSFLTKDQVKAYVQKRMNDGLTECGFDGIFLVDEKLLEETSWFDIQISSTMQTDFFKKRSNTYTKRAEAYSADSLF